MRSRRGGQHAELSRSAALAWAGSGSKPSGNRRDLAGSDVDCPDWAGSDIDCRDLAGSDVDCPDWAGSDIDCRDLAGSDTDCRGLSGSHIVAWLVDLDATADVLDVRRLLSSAERDRAASFLLPRDGMRFAASRAWLRVVASRYLGADAANLRLASGAGGRPGLIRHRGSALHYSLSRAAERGLVAVSRAPVGADIERADRREGIADLVAARFAPAEVACLARSCGGNELRGFYRHWTAKEAFLKATGQGLAGLRDTTLICGERPVIEYAGRPVQHWTVSLLEPAPGYLAAIVGVGAVTSWRVG